MQEARTNKYVFFGRVRGCRRYSRICFVRGCAIPATHDITTYVIVSHGDWKNARTGRGDPEQNVKNCFCFGKNEELQKVVISDERRKVRWCGRHWRNKEVFSPTTWVPTTRAYRKYILWMCGEWGTVCASDC
jgi:hypothetical protein